LCGACGCFEQATVNGKHRLIESLIRLNQRGQRMPRRTASLLAAFALAAVVSAAPADARRTVIDQGQFIDIGSPIDACTIGGAPCDPTILPFSFDFGTGLTNEAFIYDRGIISFGDPISGGADANADFTTFGVPVIAPLYVPGATGTAGPYEAFAGTIGAGDFPETLPNFGTDLFVISFLDPSAQDPNSFLTPYVHVLIDASSGEIRFEFIHGQSFLDENQILTLALPNTTGTQLGYLLGTEQVLADPPNIEGINAFTFPGAAGGVPQPGTWAMMLLGFGAVGFSMRRRRTSAARTLAAA
jgi:PEP-CTERM motif